MTNNKGSILAVVIVLILVFTIIGMFTMRLVVMQQSNADTELYFTRAHYAALSASEIVLFNIMSWENVASTDTTGLNPAGRKFLPETPGFLGWNGAVWKPTATVDNLVEKATDTIALGITIHSYVEEEVGPGKPDPNDGYIVDVSNPGSREALYGTYKYYVIKTSATIYSSSTNKTKETEKASAEDELHFMIAYSSGPGGAKLPNDSAVATGPEFIKSAPQKSFITGEVLPIFRYYIRGRR